MNPRSPTEVLTVRESEQLRVVVQTHGEEPALRLVGLRSAETLYKAIARFPVHQLTASTIRGRLRDSRGDADRIG